MREWCTFWAGGLRLPLIAAALGLALSIPAAATERLPALNVVQSGHSLTDPILEPLSMMVRATSIRGGRLDKATIPGSPMDWRWENATDPNIRQPIIMAQYDVLVITERVALTTTMDSHNSTEWALHWFEHAWSHGANGLGARSVLYASWVDLDSGPDYRNTNNDPEGHIPFRERLPLEMERWQTILDHVNANRSADAPAMRMIPGPLVMARAYDDIEAGLAPGIASIEDLFSDTIHVNELGAYLIALAHFAVVYDHDPRGLPNGVPARGGPDPEQAAWMQALVWEVLNDYALAYPRG